MELALRTKMRKEFNKQLGHVNFAMASREESLEISVPIQDNVLYVIAKHSTDYKTTKKNTGYHITIILKCLINYLYIIIIVIQHKNTLS